MDVEQPSTGGLKSRITSVTALLAVIVLLLVLVVLVLLFRGGSSSESGSGSSGSIGETVSVTEGGFTYLAPKELVTVKWGQSATLPDGLVVKAWGWEELPNEPSTTGTSFRYQVEYMNESDKPLSTKSATYAVKVGTDSVQPCSRVTGPPNMIPPRGIIQPGQKLTGWVGAGCPAGTTMDTPASLEIGQNSELAAAVIFVP